MTKVQTNAGDIEIRTVHTIAECRHVQTLQQLVWETSDRDLVPAHMLLTISKNGGILLGAFAPDGPTDTDSMVAFVLGWPGYGDNGRGQPIAKHCSHMVAVLPKYRQRGIGLRLKLAQREAVLAQRATEWVTWTFDPLQRVNAVFNLHRLGASSQTYVRDAYGQMDDALNVGLPTDRLQVDWWLRSPRVLAAIAPEQTTLSCQLDDLRILPPPAPGVAGVPDLSDLEAGTPLAVPLPDAVDVLRTKDRSQLSQWRYYLRSVLPTAFERSYQITDCIVLPDTGWHYILTPS